MKKEGKQFKFMFAIDDYFWILIFMFFLVLGIFVSAFGASFASPFI